MIKHGTYNVKNDAKDRSFTYFTCWLTVFLVLLLAVYLVLMYYTGNLKRIQNQVVDKNALNDANPSHGTTMFIGTIKEDNVANGLTEVIRSAIPSGYTRESNGSNQSQGRPVVESTSLKTDNATVQYSTEKYAGKILDIFSSEQSTTATDSTVVTKLIKWSQSPKNAPHTFSTPATIQHQGIPSEKQNFQDETVSNQASSATTQSSLVTDVTKWIQTSKDAPNRFFTPTAKQHQGIPSEKQNFLDETFSKQPSSTATQSSLVTDVTKWNETPKYSPNILFVPKTMQQQKTTNVLDEMVSKEPSFTANESTLVTKLVKNQSPNGATDTFFTPTKIQYQGIPSEKQNFLTEKERRSTTTKSRDFVEITKLNQSPTQSILVIDLTKSNRTIKPNQKMQYQDIATTKQNFLDEKYAKEQSSTSTESKLMEITKLNQSSTRPSHKSVIPKITTEHRDHYTVKSKILDVTPRTEPSSTVSESKVFMQSKDSNELQNVPTSKSTTFRFLQSANTSVQELMDTFYTRKITKAQDAITELETVDKHTSLPATTNMINIQNGIKLPYNQTAYSSIIELLSVTGSLLPLTESLTQIATTPAGHTTVNEDHVAEQFDLESFNNLDGGICDGHICRRAAAKTLYQIDFDADVCKYPYTYFCGGGRVKKWDFLDIIFKELISFIKRVDDKSSAYFQVFANNFHMCNKFNWFNVMEQMNIDDAKLPKDNKDLIGELLLIQSIPFFDIDVSPIGNLFQIQEYFFETYEDPEENYVNITMKDFCDGKNYHLGVEWRHLLLAIGIPYNATNIIRIYYPEKVKKVISEAMENGRELIDILKAWHRIQAYSNMIQLLNRNNARYCLELVSELMPEVASVVVQEAVDESMYNDSLSTVKTLFDSLKQTFIKSLRKMNVERTALKVSEHELNKVRLMPSMKLTHNGANYDVKVENTLYGSIMALLKHRRKSVFRLINEKVEDEFLLKYFVNPFDSRLHTFYPYETIVFQPGFLYRAFEMEFLPRQIYLSKIGFVLAEALVKLYVHVEMQQSKTNKLNDISGYGYLIEGDEYSFSSWNLSANQMENDKRTFELIFRYFLQDSREIEQMIWLNGTLSNSQAFITSTMQEFCDWSRAADVTKELYNSQLPAPIRIRSLMLNSKLTLESYKCY